MNKATTLSNDDLMETFIEWTRIYRNEGKLNVDERSYYKTLVAEVKKRKLLD